MNSEADQKFAATLLEYAAAFHVIVGANTRVFIEWSLQKGEGLVPVVKWAVRDNQRRCLSSTGTWDYEPRPAKRTAEWLDAHRYDTLEAAWKTLVTAMPLPEKGDGTKP